MEQATEHTFIEIPMTSVDSSQIEAIGYDAPSQTLRVKFARSGGAYDYAGVPPDVHEAFSKAESLGKFLAAHVKGKFQHLKLPEQ